MESCTLWNKATDRDIDETIDIYRDIVAEECELYEPDAHSCRSEADEYGYCQVCGSIVHGSLADYEEHGYDPPEAQR